jgi:hypothetical protein
MNVLQYLASLPAEFRAQLYGYHDTTRAIFAYVEEEDEKSFFFLEMKFLTKF